MAISLHNLRDELRETTGMDETDLPDNIAERYLNLSWWELQDKVKFREKENRATLNLVAGTRSYLLTAIDPSIDNITSVAISQLNTTQFNLINKRDYHAILDESDSDTYARGVPSEYATYGTSIYFDPIPDAAHVAEIVYRETLQNIPAGGPPVPQVWHEFVLLGAIARVFRRNGEFQKSAAIRMERDALAVITVPDIVKETEDFRMVGIHVVRAPYR
jgi:hypothetical protein